MMNLLWMLEGTGSGTGSGAETPANPLGTDSVGEIWDKISPILTTVLYVLAGVLLVLLLVKGITTAMAVVKAADEPQVRQEKLNAFKYMAIGLGVAIVILTVSATVINIAGSSIKKESSPTAFLF